MKTKKFQKKLVLKRGTVAHLNSDEANKVKGGCAETDYKSCPTMILTNICCVTYTVCPTNSGVPCCR